jgi:glyoxylase-like metal-dependent hydrolase (beta-lactamase superfamily II)
VTAATGRSRPPATPERVGCEEGLWRLAVPTPFAIGPVNVYVLDDGDEVTLVDSGPNSATSLADLERQLGLCGRSVADVGRVLITHQHADHAGLAGTVAARSGARVACLGAAAPYLEHWAAALEQDDEYGYEIMLRHGVDRMIANVLRASARVPRGFGAPVVVDEPLADGQAIVVSGRTLRAVHLPGHSPSDVAFVDGVAGLAFLGDVLVPQTASTTVMARPLDPRWTGAAPTPLLDHRASLATLGELDVALALPGHGAPFTDPGALISARLRKQDERAGLVRAALDAGPRTAYELARRFHPAVAAGHVFNGLCEALGLLDLLRAAGAVVADDDTEPVRFALAA